LATVVRRNLVPIPRTSRYYALDTFEVDGVVTVAQRLTAPPSTFTDSIRHTVVGAETPDALAKLYYGREDLWWRIADANPGRFALDWKPGDVLVVPPLRVATRTPRS
jgi:hypothetical protein